MTKRAFWLGLLVLTLLLANCTAKTTPTEPPEPTATTTASQDTSAAEPTAAPESPLAPTNGRLLISEVLLGVQGNNNLEFVELYNTGTQPIDLNGWSLWYLLNTGQQETQVFAWQDQADVPGLGHYLLTRTGQDVGLMGDAEYDVPLFDKKGGLLLRKADGETADVLGWGTAPDNFYASSPALAPTPGDSLERLPGGTAGNGQDTADNAADMVVSTGYAPQNSGSPLTPPPAGNLTIFLDIPTAVEPGHDLELSIQVGNQTEQSLQNVLVSLPIPAGFEVATPPTDATQVDGGMEWSIDELAVGGSLDFTLSLQSPWTYLDTIVRGAFVSATNWPVRAYSTPSPLSVSGGSIPIATARTLDGQVVTIEGVATMYTGAFYAGSTGTKFYLQDETGGIQVFCPGGAGIVEVALGDRVRVTGEIDVYNNSLEIIPGTYPEDVEILDSIAAELSPTPASIKDATSDETILGQLIQVEGIVTRIQEFSYSYEIDLVDQDGFTQLVYIEKETGISVEPFEIGQIYRVAGISEIYVNDWQLKPRTQNDFEQIFPPELTLSIQAPNSVLPGEMITISLTALNHTPETLSNVIIMATQPEAEAIFGNVLDDGILAGTSLSWTIPELPSDGGQVTVRYTLDTSQDAQGRIVIPPAEAIADQWSAPARTNAHLAFIGSGVPIWAIQGADEESPYARSNASTEGIVTGVFPELSGFWIQEIETDNDPATSAGLFVLVEPELEIDVQPGDLVQITGKVRERSGETLLHLTRAQDLVVVNSNNQLPSAVELDPPQDKNESISYYEALEGMLVSIDSPAIAVAPTTKYGETVVVNEKWGIDRVMRGEATGLFIFVDDGSATTHLDSTSLPFALASGDTIANVIGPLAFTYDNYKIEPIAQPIINSVERSLPMLEPVGESGFSIATFNAENLFDFQDPHPSDPPRPSLNEYRQKLAKTAAAIEAMGAPTIIGLQEIENIGILEDLAEQDAIATFDYQPFLVEGTDSRGIDVGYLVRADQTLQSSATAYPAPEGLTSRPPLLISVTLKLAGNPTVYVLNNHFTSMSGGEAPTEPRRNAQALWNITLVERILTQEPDAYVVILGDLNSFYDALPLESLRAGGLRHVYELVEPDIPYSYIYQGESETLDHILMTESLFERLVSVDAVHINADYPLAAPDDISPMRGSDHDPIVAIFELE